MGRESFSNAIYARPFMILVDSSVWIDLFAGKHTKATNYVISAINETQDLCICGPIITEVLQGIRSDKEYEKVKSILSELIYLPISKSTFFRSASIYRSIRKNGKTIHSPIDCIIASICLEHEVKLLHNDKDFIVISQYTSLELAE
jgi:predicted nucleic acid-binding protein